MVIGKLLADADHSLISISFTEHLAGRGLRQQNPHSVHIADDPSSEGPMNMP
jgi:hypothetical protein